MLSIATTISSWTVGFLANFLSNVSTSHQPKQSATSHIDGEKMMGSKSPRHDLVVCPGVQTLRKSARCGYISQARAQYRSFKGRRRAYSKWIGSDSISIYIMRDDSMKMRYFQITKEKTRGKDYNSGLHPGRNLKFHSFKVGFTPIIRIRDSEFRNVA